MNLKIVISLYIFFKFLFGNYVIAESLNEKPLFIANSTYKFFEIPVDLLSYKILLINNPGKDCDFKIKFNTLNNIDKFSPKVMEIELYHLSQKNSLLVDKFYKNDFTIIDKSFKNLLKTFSKRENYIYFKSVDNLYVYTIFSNMKVSEVEGINFFLNPKFELIGVNAYIDNTSNFFRRNLVKSSNNNLIISSEFRKEIFIPSLFINNNINSNNFYINEIIFLLKSKEDIKDEVPFYDIKFTKNILNSNKIKYTFNKNYIVIDLNQFHKLGQFSLSSIYLNLNFEGNDIRCHKSKLAFKFL